ncbi:hypothetical protein A2U01_0030787, partial [Trifolium medium]|nr:hypothetical protein [Trifolium medium]
MIATDPGKSMVGEKELTTFDELSSNKGDDFQNLCQNKEGEHILKDFCGEKGIESRGFRRCQENMLSCEEVESDGFKGEGTGEGSEVGPLFSSSQVAFGPCLLGSVFSKDKGKALLVSSCAEGVDKTNLVTFKGGCSVGPSGP